MNKILTLVAVLLLGACAYVHPQVPNSSHIQGMNSVVIIEGFGGHGSGVLVKREAGGLGTFLTNEHVCRTFNKTTRVRFSDGSNYKYRRIVATNAADDICRFTAMIDDQTPIKVAAFAPIMGAHVCALGSPLNYEFILSCGTKLGRLSGRGSSRMLTDILVYSGSSGGPILNAQGHLVGLTSSGAVMDIWGKQVPLGYQFMTTLEAIKNIL